MELERWARDWQLESLEKQFHGIKANLPPFTMHQQVVGSTMHQQAV